MSEILNEVERGGASTNSTIEPIRVRAVNVESGAFQDIQNIRLTMTETKLASVKTSLALTENLIKQYEQLEQQFSSNSTSEKLPVSRQQWQCFLLTVKSPQDLIQLDDFLNQIPEIDDSHQNQNLHQNEKLNQVPDNSKSHGSSANLSVPILQPSTKPLVFKSLFAEGFMSQDAGFVKTWRESASTKYPFPTYHYTYNLSPLVFHGQPVDFLRNMKIQIFFPHFQLDTLVSFPRLKLKMINGFPDPVDLYQFDYDPDQKIFQADLQTPWMYVGTKPKVLFQEAKITDLITGAQTVHQVRPLRTRAMNLADPDLNFAQCVSKLEIEPLRFVSKEPLIFPAQIFVNAEAVTFEPELRDILWNLFNQKFSIDKYQEYIELWNKNKPSLSKTARFV